MLGLQYHLATLPVLILIVTFSAHIFTNAILMTKIMTNKRLIEILQSYTPEDEVKISISVYTFNKDGETLQMGVILGDIDRVVVGGWPIIIESTIQTQINITPLLI